MTPQVVQYHKILASERMFPVRIRTTHYRAAVMPKVSQLVRVAHKYAKLSYIRNFPKTYIDKEKGTVAEKVYGNRFGAPAVVEWKIEPEEYWPSGNRPWEIQDQRFQQSKQREKKILNKPKVEVPDFLPIPDDEWLFFPGDRVEIMVGRDKGKQGYVLAVFRELNQVYVEGLHCKFVTRPGSKAENFPDMVIKEEQPLDVAKGEVKLVDPVTTNATDAEWKYTEDGEVIRLSASEREIKIPSSAFATYEYMTPDTYFENEDKDTPADLALEITLELEKLRSTFEEEILESMNIKETRKYGKTYWY